VKNGKKIIEASKKFPSASRSAAYLGIHFRTYRTWAKKYGVYNSNMSGKGIEKNYKHAFKLEDVLNGEYPHYGRVHLKERLLKEGILKNECSECGISEWKDKPLICHLDHKNGIGTDHRLKNLRMLCPNCHSQTLTYAGKNKNNIHKR
jgi:hypothetical protein